ncbi:hypothetical protein [Flagellimonas onchidii]|nr:hypothetical protein [Allomuricauda onchidii]
MKEAVIDNPTEVAALHTSLTRLSVLISTDARSMLSIIVTSTDNDGD